MMIAEDEYRSLIETLHLSHNPKFKKSLIEGKKTPYEESLSEDDVNW